MTHDNPNEALFENLIQNVLKGRVATSTFISDVSQPVFEVASSLCKSHKKNTSVHVVAKSIDSNQSSQGDKDEEKCYTPIIAHESYRDMLNFLQGELVAELDQPLREHPWRFSIIDFTDLLKEALADGDELNKAPLYDEAQSRLEYLLRNCLSAHMSVTFTVRDDELGSILDSGLWKSIWRKRLSSVYYVQSDSHNALSMIPEFKDVVDECKGRAIRFTWKSGKHAGLASIEKHKVWI